MARRVFYSFHFQPDNWRASQIRNIGAIEGNSPASDNDWEAVKRGGEEAIKRWIDSQLSGRGCTVVLIGSSTAGRKWINYEIKKSWDDGKGLLGIYIHRLKDKTGNQASQGKNPFDGFTLREGKVNLANVVKAYDPPHWESTAVYEYIKSNLATWIDDAIKIRQSY